MAKQTFYEGQTATNHATGERLVYRSGKWFPLTDGGATAPVSSGTEQDRKALQSLRDDASQSLATSEAANRFVDLNKQSPTGGLIGRPVVPFTKAIPGAPLWGDVGAALTGDPNWSQMKAINSQLAPAQREPGSGASSDLDVKMFRESLPNVETPGPANQMNAKRLQEASDKAAARSAFMDEWFARRGNLLGAEQQFATFWSKRKAGDPVANNLPPEVRNLRKGDPTARANRAIAGGGKNGFKILGVE